MKEKTKKDLLIDIISRAPNNSRWFISKNSWDRIPLILNPFDFEDNLNEWSVLIKNNYKPSLINIIEEEELYEKIIRQFIINEQGEVIMESFDVMMMTILGDSFPLKNELLIKYHDEDLSLE